MAGWNGWAALGGDLSGGAPVVGVNADGRLEVFAEGPGAAGPELDHIWQTTAGNGWDAWASLGSPPAQFLGAPTVARNADGRLEAFVRVGLMSAGALWHIWQTAPDGGWSDWDNLGGPVGAHLVRVAENQDGRLEVFVLSPIGELNHIWQTAAGASWSGWANLGSPAGVSLTTAVVGQNADGRLDALCGGSDGALWEIAQTAAGGGWGSWTSLGAPTGVSLGESAVGRNADGRLEVFVVGAFNQLWHIWQTSAGGPWSAWASLGSPPGAAQIAGLSVASNADGRLEVFTGVLNGDVWHIWQTAPNGGWSSWDDLGGEPVSIGVGQNADGRLELFSEARVPAGTQPLWHRWQVSPGGAWSTTEDWEQSALAGPAQTLFTPADGVLLARTQAGLFRSSDDGDTWTAVALPASPGRVAVDPGSSSTIYAAGSGGLFRTTNGGATWTLVLTVTDSVIGLAVSPADHGLVYAVTASGSGSFVVQRSANGGASWTLIEGPENGSLCTWTVLILAPHPTNANRVFRTSGCYAGRNVPFGDSLTQSTDRGATWTSLFHPTPLFPSRLVGGSGASPARYYLSAYFGADPGGGKLFRSDDDAATWTQVLSFASGPSVGGQACDATSPDVVFAGLTSGVVQASTDGGSTWSQLGSANLGGVGDLALTRDGRFLVAATALGVWRIHR